MTWCGFKTEHFKAESAITLKKGFSKLFLCLCE